MQKSGSKIPANDMDSAEFAVKKVAQNIPESVVDSGKIAVQKSGSKIRANDVVQKSGLENCGKCRGFRRNCCLKKWLKKSS